MRKDFTFVSIIVSTYNHPVWLEKVLWGFYAQSNKDFEIIIADDGSGLSTEEVIKKMRKVTKMTIQHVWQEDVGFQKSRILNKAVIAANGNYLIFTDGDCIPRNDFVDVHLKHCSKGKFLSGGYYKLPLTTSKLITKEDILSQRCFKIQWLYKNGVKESLKDLKIVSNGWLSKIMNKITPASATWNGNNSSGWKEDIIKVNGFDNSFKYGGQDREMGQRLINIGIKPVIIRFSTVSIHLDHSRGYADHAVIKKNRAYIKQVKEEKIKRVSNGISEILK
ncbi:glycosyltransferase [Echinicola jeungdonensis]|uniref:Glycosyltransferase n=1 Tax=Echinicola jeungdonensis TaxID=709343 RepID=A0ABV5J555_9BACT|nr:glycosyltransferase [Echinicola jeungdonensis]MDN3668635.1 glycosyltransferase [Echinicola jeungdonensis]